MQPCHADTRIGLINSTIGFNAQIILGNAFAAAKASGAIIPGAGVDFVEFDHIVRP